MGLVLHKYHHEVATLVVDLGGTRHASCACICHVSKTTWPEHPKSKQLHRSFEASGFLVPGLDGIKRVPVRGREGQYARTGTLEEVNTIA